MHVNFEQAGISVVIQDGDVTVSNLLQALKQISEREQEIVSKIKELNIKSAVDKIIGLIKEQAHVESPRTV